MHLFNRKDSELSAEIRMMEDEINLYNDYIKDYFARKFEVIEKLANHNEVIEFLSTCNQNTYTVQHDNYEEIIHTLRKIYEEWSDIYLVFIGMYCNGDAIDNNGRSRQHECREGLRQFYISYEREWYKETQQDANNLEPTVTLPYRDTSGSYVVSITKEIRDCNGRHLGVAGIDVLFRNIVRKNQSRYQIIIITNTGEIVYNSRPYIKDILERQHNIILMLEPDTLDFMSENESGYRCFKNSSNDCIMVYKRIVQNKYYMISIFP
jgi:hypothetical protein